MRAKWRKKRVRRLKRKRRKMRARRLVMNNKTICSTIAIDSNRHLANKQLAQSISAPRVKLGVER
ncbi:uncharacterized protein BDV14DRAFT_170719 [Aspergillus stella-maris]|uniref:uncharacterized protein n=1 Tax=Aspergillus stella-maris TaxID=1810926 RepID=UPI003CCD58D4